MPVYEYACTDCGPFTATRAMAEFREPYTCPDCGSEARRVMLTAPAVGAGQRADGDRSSPAPPPHVHGASCGCG